MFSSPWSGCILHSLHRMVCQSFLFSMRTDFASCCSHKMVFGEKTRTSSHNTFTYLSCNSKKTMHLSLHSQSVEPFIAVESATLTPMHQHTNCNTNNRNKIKYANISLYLLQYYHHVYIWMQANVGRPSSVHCNSYIFIFACRKFLPRTEILSDSKYIYIMYLNVCVCRMCSMCSIVRHNSKYRITEK